jgi:endoglucanase
MIIQIFTRPWLAIVFFIFVTSAAYGQGFLKTNGKKIVDESGNEVLLRGMGLGGWMLMEGYMMQSSDVADTQWEFRARLEELMGVEKTDEFFNAWLENHVTKADIDSLASWGYNSVRLAMHYNLFTLPIEEEPVPGENTWLTKGFELTDNLLAWCEENSIYLILDLHAAPGGQGENAAISDYDPSKPSLWESKDNRDKTVALWKKLAERYKDEEWIGGYDLINETNWYKDDMGPNNFLLRQLMGEITDSIRAVGDNHIVFIEGNSWANDFNGMTPPWDDNMAYSFHKYWSHNDQGSIQWVLDIREQHNVPLWMGEAGENSNVWFTEAISLFEQNGIGWSWWPMKRIETIVAPYSIPFTDGYKQILQYWRGQAPKPTVNAAYAAMMELAINTNSQHCLYRKDVHDAKIRQPHTDEILAFNTHTLPGILYLSDYDLGKNGYAYFDVDVANYSLSTGSFQAWNSGWVYRNDGVDIEANEDPINSNGYHIGFLSKGEWMKYTIQVEESGSFTAIARVASVSNGGKFHLKINDEDITSQQTIGSTGGWTNFENMEIYEILLNQGQNVLTFHKDDGAEFNISSIEFIKTGEIEDIAFYCMNGETVEDEKSVMLFVNHPIDAESINEAADQFQVKVNNEVQAILSLSMKEVHSRTLILEIEKPVLHTDIITVSYTGDLITSPSGKVLEQFADLRIRNTLPLRFMLPTIIQAEDWNYQEGLVLEVTSDTGGGYNFGYTSSGDFADYRIAINETADFNLSVRVASTNSNGVLRFILIDDFYQVQANRVISQFNIPNTGGWQKWTSISKTVSLPKGFYKLRLYIVSPEFNVNWFRFELNDVTGIEDEGKIKYTIPVIYPNPVSGDELFISFDHQPDKYYRADIYSISGSLLSSTIISDRNGPARINMANIPKGLAILRLYTNDKVANYKIIRM